MSDESKEQTEPVPEGSAEDSEWGQKAKEIFTKYDANGDGSISEDELVGILSAISGENGEWSKDEVKALLLEADANSNGKIEFAEFINWLTNGDGMGKAVLNYGEAFKILFSVYDKDNSGSIDAKEFAEAHSLLQAALRIADSEEEVETNIDPLDLQKDQEAVFSGIDKDVNKSISLFEFVDWMKDRVPPSMAADDLADILKHLADMLADAYYHIELAEEGYIKEEDSHILKGVIKKLAAATRSMEKSLGDGLSSEPVKSQWSEPPVGLSVERLKSAHMGYYALPVKRVKDVSWEIMCLPLPGPEDPDTPAWLGGVIRRVNFKSGRKIVEDVHWYVYDRETFSWKVLSEDCYGFAWQGLEKITPGIAIFCCLKTQANFGSKLRWDGVTHSLDGAVDLKYLTQEQKDAFDAAIMKHIEDQLDQDGMTFETERQKWKYVQDWIHNELVMRPREVMGLLSHLGFVEIDPAWQDYV